MELQSFQKKDGTVIDRFLERRRGMREGGPRLKLSWSNWGFGTEPLEDTAARLERHGIRHIELHGNRYGPDLGYEGSETRRILDDHGIQAAGVCGIVTPDCELSSTRPHVTQRCIDYLRRQIEMCAELGGSYLLLHPGAVGRTRAYDENEAQRAADALRVVAPDFEKAGVRCCVEPVRAAEVSFCHTFGEVRAFIEAVGHRGVRHIAGDLYHMLVGERHIGETILEYGDDMINLHMADTNREALGEGFLDLDLVIMALYAIGYDEGERFCTPEPLGPGGDPYPAMFGRPDADALESLVGKTASCFRAREAQVLAASDAELRRC
jgi:D-psicose/D-tagatose/L-ribulose 3-epimerase